MVTLDRDIHVARESKPGDPPQNTPKTICRIHEYDLEQSGKHVTPIIRELLEDIPGATESLVISISVKITILRMSRYSGGTSDKPL